MKNSRLSLFLICLVLTGIPVFFGCNTGDTPKTPQTDPVPAEFVGTWQNDSSDWQMEISGDSKFTFSGTVEAAKGFVTASGNLAKDRATGTYTITAMEVTLGGAKYTAAALGLRPLSDVGMNLHENSLTITPPTPPEGETPHMMAGFIGGTYTKSSGQ
jgi:hypothetical protein